MFHVGVSHTAAAMLAVQRFNARDAKVVHDLTTLTNDCNITLNGAQVLDTQLVTHKSAQDFMKSLHHESRNDNSHPSPSLPNAATTPCALAGRWTN